MSVLNDPELLKWALGAVTSGSLAAVGFFFKEAREAKRVAKELEDEATDKAVATIKEAIDNLSESIQAMAKDSRDTNNRIWSHIGFLERCTLWLIGQHEANHHTKCPITPPVAPEVVAPGG